MSTKKFPLITLRGTPEEIGSQHGEILKDKIHSTVSWYKNIISKDEKRILKLVKHFKSVIERFDPLYSAEIEAIAASADIQPDWIYMLNSRSEIMNIFQNECTAFYFRSSGILGQNWDWAQHLENLAVLMKLEQEDKPDILMMTEPGIIGKIGFNTNGVGICLNFLDSGKQARGVPIHLILRKVLDAPSIESSLSSIKPHMSGKSANILIGDSTGFFTDIEFANDINYQPSTTSNIFLHTNHYLENDELNVDLEKLANSFHRYQTGLNLIRNTSDETVNEMKQLLLDRSDSLHPICRHYIENPDIGTVGTVCTIIMDLKKLQMHITRGNPLNTQFSIVSF
jgi:isopenicillin-N N-acyltransferase-like protein